MAIVGRSPVKPLALDLKAVYRGAVRLLARALLGSLVIACQTQATPAAPPGASGGPTEAELNTDFQAEKRLLGIYELIGSGRYREALQKAEQLVKDVPHFQLAQLVYGDLLASRIHVVKTLGDVTPEAAASAGLTLGDLRQESQRRLEALRERPPANTIPSQFLKIAMRSKHVIAVDASRSRLYLFENTPSGPRLLRDYYVSVGKAGVSKAIEGDQRTPLGVYYVTGLLNRKTLGDFYGSGALPINYPNMLDLRRSKSGRGIWLHGTPSSQFARAPQATDGCLVISNPDLHHLSSTVEVQTTPIVVAPKLTWVSPASLEPVKGNFETVLQEWRTAKSRGDWAQVQGFYASDFNSYGRNLSQWLPELKAETAKARSRQLQIKDLTLLSWVDTEEVMVVTFSELGRGAASGPLKRQYWVKIDKRWKIFFEGVIG
jgi:murein L,D-transpeptidase YafK